MLRLAEPHLTVPGKGGAAVRIGAAIGDMRAYSARRATLHVALARWPEGPRGRVGGVPNAE